MTYFNYKSWPEVEKSKSYASVVKGFNKGNYERESNYHTEYTTHNGTRNLYYAQYTEAPQSGNIQSEYIYPIKYYDQSNY